MNRTFTERLLPLAAMFQTVRQVQTVAHHGKWDVEALERDLLPLFQINPPDTATVYGSTEQLREGLQLLFQQFTQNGRPDAELLRYLIALMHLERKLSRSPERLDTIRRGLEEVERQRKHFPLTHENVLAKLADIYANAISTLQPRIMVQGSGGHLQRSENANRIRALLLSAMRSAILWRQNGGRRWQILFQRKAMATEAKNLLNRIDGT